MYALSKVELWKHESITVTVLEPTIAAEEHKRCKLEHNHGNSRLLNNQIAKQLKSQ